MATITTLGFTIFSTYDGRGTTQARRDINGLTNDVQRNNIAMTGGISGMRALATAAVALGPALVPIGAGLTAVASGFAAITSAAGIAGGIWGIATMGAIKSTTQLGKELTVANKNLADQKEKLSQLTPGTKAYKDQLLKVKDAQAKVNQIMGQMSPVQARFVHDTDAMKSAWANFIRQTSGSTLGPVNVVMETLTANMGKFKPIVESVGKVAMGVAVAFKSWTNNGGLDRFINLIQKYGVPALATLMGIARNVLAVLGDGFRAFLPLGNQVLDVIAKGAKKLAEWSSGGGFNRFLDYVRANAPALKDFFKNLGDALLTIGQALKGMGGSSLSVTNALLKLVGGLPPGVIQALAVAWVAWNAAMTVWAAIAPIVTSETFALAAAEVAAAWPIWLIVAAVVAVIAVFVALGIGIYELVTHWTAVSNAFKTAWNATWEALKVATQAVWTALQIAYHAFVNGMATAWNAVSGALTAAWSATWNAIKAAGEAVWNAIKAAWSAVGSALTTTWNSVSGALKAAWSAVWNAMKTAGEAVWNAIKVAWQAVGTALTTVWNTVSSALKSAWSAAWNAMKTAADTIWTALKTAWSAALNAMKAAWDTFSNALKAAWSATWNAIKTAAETVWNALKTAWSAFTAAIKAAYEALASLLKSAWSTFWNGLKTVAEGVWKLMQKGWDDLSSGIQKTLSGLVDKAKTIWNGIVEVFKTPVNLVIGIWDAVAGAVGLPKIAKLAAGGEVGGVGHSKSDNVPALLSPGEFVMPASAVRRYGMDTMESMRRHRFAAGGAVTGSGGGGVTIPGVGELNTGTGKIDPGTDVVGNAVGGALAKLASIAGDVVYDVTKPLLDKIISAIPHPMPGVATPAGDVPYSAAKKIEEAALSMLKKKQEEAKAIGGVIPAGQHKAIIDAALKAAGVPPPGTLSEWEAGLNTLITRESAWNSGAINNTDSNAAAGHPSQGLAQTIPSTFNAYHVAGTSNNILDPVANVAAAIRYIVATYGNITNVQQANANLPPKGYWTGTGNATSGWKLYGENGPELVHSGGGEKVLDAARTRRALHGRGGGDGETHFHDGAFRFDLRGASKEAVEYTEGELCDKLRMAVQAGVGKRGY